ncbi:MAG: hypothetical protein J3T61_12965 [Candidatus Brocadiales bacterium]|nr:hypothetical protein [Candidatus Bathyanammoxibius sp.]
MANCMDCGGTECICRFVGDIKKLKKACRLLMSGVYGNGYLTNCGTLKTERAVRLMVEAGQPDPRNIPEKERD